MRLSLEILATSMNMTPLEFLRIICGLGGQCNKCPRLRLHYAIVEAQLTNSNFSYADFLLKEAQTH